MPRHLINGGNLKAIYKPKGKALEYGEYACNLYKGCGHGCTYCYAPSVLRMDRKEFYNNPQPRDGNIEALKRDAKTLGAETMPSVVARQLECFDAAMQGGFSPPPKRPPFIFLCFTCDPYQPINQKYQLTRQAIEIIHGEGLGVNILTKGIITDFDLLAKNPHLSKVGITVTGDNGTYEKHIPLLAERYNNLHEAHKAGIPAWISFEPIINVDAVLRAIPRLIGVDEFKIGKWNYSPEAKKIDWYKFGHEVEELCQKLGVNYYIKEDLRKEMNLSATS
jgi:DNA repair photolyase